MSAVDLTQIGRYKIETLIGSGSFADVYKALDTVLQTPVPNYWEMSSPSLRNRGRRG